MGPFHSSVFRLAQQVRATLVPVAVSGSEQVPPRGSLLLHPATIRVHKLPCLRWEDYQQMSTFQLKSEVHERLRRHLASIESDAT
jgi:1-acyl-sn-glycerol-3-phosphate acyltransferase